MTIPQQDRMPDPPDPVALADAYLAAFDLLRAAVLVGQPAPRVEAARLWMENVRPGHLVVVDFRAGQPAQHCIGEYVAVWSHLFPPDDLGHYDGAPGALYSVSDTVHGIVDLTGTLRKWSNCQLRRVPRNQAELSAALDVDTIMPGWRATPR